MRFTQPLPALLLSVTLLSGGCAGLTGQDKAVEPDGTPPDSPYVTAFGSRLYRDGEVVQLRAINFGNGYLEASQEIVRGTHHSAADLARVTELGFDTIRFAMNGNWYERDRAGFLTWLDGNIALARHAGLGVILDLHVPIGGFWLDSGSDEADFSLWSDASLRERNITLWQDVAARYADEPAITGYDLLNEPVTLDEDGKQWRTFAAELARAIRAVDEHHLIVLEHVYGTDGRYGSPGEDAQFLLDDTNVLYDTHFRSPVEFTQQGTRWRGTALGDGGRYPDPDVLRPTGQHRLDVPSRVASANLPDGTTDWAIYASRWQTPAGRKLVAAVPRMTVRGPLGGRIHFDDLVVRERLPDGSERVLVDDGLDGPTSTGWFDWSSQTAGNTVIARRVVEDENTDLMLELRGTGINTVAGWSNAQHWFRVTPGASYRIEGRMRGENVRYIAGERGSAIGFEIEFFARKNKRTPVVRPRDRDLLAAELERWTAFGRRHAVPVSVLEIGLVTSTFEPAGKGGATWLTDVLSLMNEQDRSYGVWAWHDRVTGLYRTPLSQPVGEPNREMLRVIEEAHAGASN
ncbi:cellulase family glycosylhydrolase [Hyphomonas sp.]|uniref:glycoside hydrolase family 5 protein n=1 Tax=Hyphomonas sp. TaxID=87 RepID=UPI0030F4D9E1